MNNKIGSYRYDEFKTETQVEELERLYRQACSLLDIERQIWTSIGLSSGDKVLDVGCGSGIITKELGKYVYPGQVTGVDISKNLLEKSERIYSTEDRNSTNNEDPCNVSFLQGEVNDLPFPDSTFDIVYARLLFQHLSEPRKALSSIRRVLKPGGTLCILDVDKAWTGMYPEPKSSMAIEQAIIQKQLEQGGDPWIGRKLGYYLKSAQFSQVKTNISIVDSDRLGLASFFGMLSFGGSYQDGENNLTELKTNAQRDIQKLLVDTNVWAGFALFTVTGKNP